MPINSRLDAEIGNRLPRAAELLAGEMRRKAPTTKIAGAISVGSVTSPTPGAYQIDVIVDLKRAPEAGAYEWGSGVHNPRNPGTYEIRPKNAKLLAFNWEGHGPDFPTGRKYRGPAPDGRLMFTFVDHPGVAARPYIRPSIQEKSAEMRQIIGRGFSVAIMAEMREAFRVE